MPHLQGGPEFDLRDTTQVPFRVYSNTPLVPHLVEFSKCAEPLRLHRTTAQILDDIRFLISLVLALPDQPSEKDLQKVQSTSAWIHNQILGLPNETPETEQRQTDETRLSMSPVGSSYTTLSWRPSAQRSPSYPPHGQGVGPSAFVIDQLASSSTPPGTPEPTNKDIMYHAVRQAALIYARAIMNRKGLSDAAVCSEQEFLSLWVTVWRIPLKVWKSVLGIFVWIMLSIAPASRDTRHARYVKSLLAVGLAQASSEDWDVGEKGMRSAVKLTTWLSGNAEL